MEKPTFWQMLHLSRTILNAHANNPFNPEAAAEELHNLDNETKDVMVNIFLGYGVKRYLRWTQLIMSIAEARVYDAPPTYSAMKRLGKKIIAKVENLEGPATPDKLLDVLQILEGEEAFTVMRMDKKYGYERCNRYLHKILSKTSKFEVMEDGKLTPAASTLPPEQVLN